MLHFSKHVFDSCKVPVSLTTRIVVINHSTSGFNKTIYGPTYARRYTHTHTHREAQIHNHTSAHKHVQNLNGLESFALDIVLLNFPLMI